MQSYSPRPLRVFYAAGPGDIVNSLRSWSAGGEDPRQLAKTYSSEFYEAAHAEEWYALAISSHQRADRYRHGRIQTTNLPRTQRARQGLAYHWEQGVYGLRLCWRALRFRAQVAIIADGTAWMPIFFLLSLLGCRVILSLHCTQHTRAQNQEGKKSLTAALDRFFFRCGVRGVLAVSKSVATEFQNIVGVRYVPVKRFFPQYPGFVAELPNPPSPQGPILYVGRIEANKGVFDLLQAYRQLRPEQELVYCGEGHALEALRAAVVKHGLSARVRLPGNLKAQELVDLYAQAACVVVPTRSDFAEGFNKVIAEALLFGKPVIATNVCPAAREFSANVRLIEPDSPDALCAALTNTLRHGQAEFDFADLSALADAKHGWSAQLRELIGKREATMRLGYLVPEFPSQTHAFFWREVRALEAEGVDVRLFSTRRPARHRCRHAFAAEARTRTTYLFPPRLSAIWALWKTPVAARAAAWSYLQSLPAKNWQERLKHAGLLFSAAQWAAAIDRQPLDHVHVHSCADAAHLAALLKRLRHISYSLSLHGDPEIYGRAQRQKMALATRVFPVTDALRQRLIHSHLVASSQVEVVRMGVDVEHFRPSGDGATAGVFQIITVARLNRMKGHRFALSALAQLQQAGHQFHYHLVGDGEERTALELLVAELNLDERVTFHGTCSEAEVRDLLGRVDAFVLPSFGKGEAAPVGVMEAMACGLPVVSSRVGGTAELLEDNVNGLLVPPQDVGALVHALERLLTEEGIAQKIGRAAREHAVAAFDFRLAAKAFLRGLQTETVPSPVRAPQRPRILAVVEQCNPQWPSVPLLTSQWVRHLAPHADITLLTHARNRLALKAADLPVEVVALEESPFIRWLYQAIQRILPGKGQNWPLLHSLTYPVYAAFDRQVRAWYDQATHEGRRWDLIWGFSPVLPRYPYSLARHKERPPFVLGPVNGGVPFPPAFQQTAKQEFARFNFLRNLGQWLPGYRATYRASDLVLVGSRHTEAFLRDTLDVPPSRLRYCPENGVTADFFAHPVPRRVAQEPLRLLFAGRLTAYKGCDMVLEALAGLPEAMRASIQLTVAGEGPQCDELKALVAENNLRDQVDFRGFVAPEAMPKLYAEAHAFCFPSVREFGGAVVMEAMAAGLPCLIVDHGGIGEYVTPETGAKVAPTSREAVVTFLRQQIATLATDEALRLRQGTQARAHAQSFAWEKKAEGIAVQMLELVQTSGHVNKSTTTVSQPA